MKYYSDRQTALYYRTATQLSIGQHLDNQMKKLLCYAQQAGAFLPLSCMMEGGGSK